MTTPKKEEGTEVKNLTEEPKAKRGELNDKQIASAKRSMGLTGYILLVGSFALFAYLLFEPETAKLIEATMDDNEGKAILLTYRYGLGLIVALIYMFVGYRLLGVSGKSVNHIIPPDDRKLLEPLISEGNEKSIKQYVVLSSLSGFTGTFQKIGFTGLPLAMVTLTLIFSALSFFEPKGIDFFELTKLTLGAFIGSFVQKQVSNEPRTH